MHAHHVGTGGRAANARRRLATTMLTSALVAGALLTSPATASTALAADETTPAGRISGRVTAPDGSGIGGVRVNVGGGGDSARVVTAADGTYTAEGLAPFAYTVEFDASRTDYATEYWRDADGAGGSGTVVVATGASVQHVDATLELAGRVTGIVTGPDGAALTSFSVSLRRADSPTSSSTDVAMTVSDGSYTFDDVRPGDYLVQFRPDPGVNLATEYWGDSPTAEGGEVLRVAAGGTIEHVDAQLATGATLSGRVTLPDGSPAPGAQVRTIGAGDPTLAFTDDDGRYEAVGLPSGDVTVLFFAPSDPTLAHEYWDDASSVSTATTVHLDAAQPTPVLDVQMGVGGSVTGRLTDPSGTPKQGLNVYAIAADTGRSFETATTDADGVYTLQGLPQAPFVIKLGDDVWGDSEYWPDADTVEAATPVTVAPGEVRSGIDGRIRAGFADVPVSHPFGSAIEWLGIEGIARGTDQPDGRVLYDPTGSVRREAMAAFLYRAAGSPAHTPPAVSPFVDVPVGAPFYGEITWLAARGITTGTVTDHGTEFRPAEPVTREAMAAFLYRFHGSRAVTVPVPYPFADVTATDPFATEIAWLPTAGIATGTDVGGGRLEFRPDELVTREAMAAFLYRAAHNLA